MRRYPALLSFLLIFSFSAVTWGADEGKSARLQEEFIAQVNFPANSFKLDRQRRKDLAKIIAKLKTTGKGKLIKLEGDYARAGSEEEFLHYSALLASSVKNYLDESGGLGNETFVATKKYRGREKEPQVNIVRIYLIPRKYRLEIIDFERLPVNQRIYRQPVEAGTPSSAEEPSVTSPSVVPPPVVQELSVEDSAAPKRLETDHKAEEQQVREAAQQADEAVAKVKARALERAKRQAEQDKDNAP